MFGFFEGVDYPMLYQDPQQFMVRFALIMNLSMCVTLSLINFTNNYKGKYILVGRILNPMLIFVVNASLIRAFFML